MRDLLRPEEGEVLLLALGEAKRRRGQGVTEDEANRVLAWAGEVRLGQVALSMVLGGELLVDVRESGEVAFGEVDGLEEVEACRAECG